MTVSSNLKTRVQNKINAVTGSTSLTELLKLKKAAEGLGCDETALETQLQARLTAMGSGTESIDLLIGNKTSGLAGRSYYTVPFNVTAGDRLYVDQLGSIHNRNHAVDVGVTQSIGSQTPSSIFCVLNHYKTGTMDNGGAETSFCLTLTDGNMMVGVRKSSPNEFYVVVLSPQLQVLSQNYFNIASGFGTNNDDTLIGIYQLTATTYRFCFIGTDASLTSGRLIHHSTVTYNTSTFLITAAWQASMDPAGQGLYQLATNWARTLVGTYRAQMRYTGVLSAVNTSRRFYLLDMQTFQVTEYATLSSLTGQDPQVIDYDQYSAGNEYAIVRNGSGGTSYACKAGGTVSNALPSAAAPFFTNNYRHRCIAQGTWVAVHTLPGYPAAIFILKFNADYSSVTVYQLLSSYPNDWPLGASLNELSVFTDGQRYWVSTGPARPVITFLWDGSSAPKGATVDWSFSGSDRAAFRGCSAPVITASDRMIYGTRMQLQATAHYGFVRLAPGEMFPGALTEFGVCLADAASGQTVEIQLSAGSDSRQSLPALNAAGFRHHQGILTKLASKLQFALYGVRVAGNSFSSPEVNRLQQELVGNVQISSVSSLAAKTNSQVKTMLSVGQNPSVDYRLTTLGAHGVASMYFPGDGNTWAMGIHLTSHAPVLLVCDGGSSIGEKRP